MFEMGKKGGPDKPVETSMQRPDAGPSRPESSAPRSSASSGGHAVIGASIHIDGDVRGEEDLLIEGEVGGTVQLKNNSLTIGPNGKVRADVYAHSIYVDGFVEGDLFGAERVHIRKSAQVKGNVTSPRVSVEDGAKFKGAIEMDPQAAQNANRPSAPRNAAPQQAPAKPVMQSQPPKPEQPAVAKTGAAS